jgi:hypothetical protein
MLVWAQVATAGITFPESVRLEPLGNRFAKVPFGAPGQQQSEREGR